MDFPSAFDQRSTTVTFRLRPALSDRISDSEGSISRTHHAKEPKYSADNSFAPRHGENTGHVASYLSKLSGLLVFQTASDALLHDIRDLLKV